MIKDVAFASKVETNYDPKLHTGTQAIAEKILITMSRNHMWARYQYCGRQPASSEARQTARNSETAKQAFFVDKLGYSLARERRTARNRSRRTLVFSYFLQCGPSWSCVGQCQCD